MGKEIYPTKLVVPLTAMQKQKLKKIAEKEAVSMNQVIRSGIDLIIKKHEKKC